MTNDVVKKENADETTAEVDATTFEEQETKPELDGETLDAIVERLKFFFSDANIRQDYFMRKHLLQGKSNDDQCPGNVPIDALLRFNTIKKYTADPEVIVNVVKNILSDMLKLSDDGKAITTVVPFTTEKLDGNIPLSLYLSNVPFNEQDKKHTCSMDDIRQLFEIYGTVALVKFRFQSRTSEGDDDDDDDEDIQPSKQSNNDGDNNKSRRRRKRYPIGAALVEFESSDALEKAEADVLTSKGGVACEPSRKLNIQDNELEVVLLKDYIASKRKRKATKPAEDGNNNGKDDEHNEKENDNDHNDHNKDDKKDLPKFILDWKPGCVIKINGIADSCDRETILEAIAKAMDLTVDQVKEQKIYVDFSRGQDHGAIRFNEPTEIITTLCTKLKDGDVEFAGSKVTSAYMLEGDEEKKYWDDFIAFKTKQKQQQRGYHKHGRHQNKRSRRN